MATPLQTAIAARGLDTMSDPNDVLNLQYKKYKNSLYYCFLYYYYLLIRSRDLEYFAYKY